MACNEEGPIYTYETNDVWKLVDNYDGVAVYAYGEVKCMYLHLEKQLYHYLK